MSGAAIAELVKTADVEQVEHPKVPVASAKSPKVDMLGDAFAAKLQTWTRQNAYQEDGGAHEG